MQPVWCNFCHFCSFAVLAKNSDFSRGRGNSFRLCIFYVTADFPCLKPLFELEKAFVKFLLILSSETIPGHTVERVDPGQWLPVDLVLGDAAEVGSAAVQGITSVISQYKDLSGWYGVWEFNITLT